MQVHSDPVPWDFYILLVLQERLGAEFDQNFSQYCTCYLYHNGCVTLHETIRSLTVQVSMYIVECVGVEQFMHAYLHV